MELMEAIYARRSVRAYDERPVRREVLETLLNAAVQAPTGMNRQPWYFGVIESRDALKDICRRAKALLLERITEDSPMAGYRERLSRPDFDIFYDAPALIVVYGDPEGVTAQIDACLAAQNIMLAACSLGLGTCWIGFAGFYLDTPEAKAELGVPEAYKAVAPLIVGYPDGPVSPVAKDAPKVMFWR